MSTGAAIGPLHPIIAALRAARLAQGLSQKEVCRRMPCAEGLVSRAEAGHTSPTLGILSRWARVLGMEIRVN